MSQHDIEVKLLVDLSRYHPSLTPGATGKTIPPAGMWAKGSDNYVSVSFDEVQLDVLWRDLEITDADYLSAERAHGEAMLDAIDAGRVKDARIVRGPRGGFRAFSFAWWKEGEKDCAQLERFSKHASAAAKPLADRLRGAGVEIEEVTEPMAPSSR